MVGCCFINTEMICKVDTERALDRGVIYWNIASEWADARERTRICFVFIIIVERLWPRLCPTSSSRFEDLLGARVLRRKQFPFPHRWVTERSSESGRPRGLACATEWRTSLALLSWFVISGVRDWLRAPSPVLGRSNDPGSNPPQSTHITHIARSRAVPP